MNIHRCDSKQIEPSLTQKEPTPKVAQPEEDWVSVQSVNAERFLSDRVWPTTKNQTERAARLWETETKTHSHWEKNNNRTVCMKINIFFFYIVTLHGAVVAWRLESWACNLKVAGSILALAGIEGGDCE